VTLAPPCRPTLRLAARRCPLASSFAHLDRVLVAAWARRLRVIVVLANRWSDYGGFPRYLR